jgi:Ca-activated chloride channel homolog
LETWFGGVSSELSPSMRVFFLGHGAIITTALRLAAELGVRAKFRPEGRLLGILFLPVLFWSAVAVGCKSNAGDSVSGAANGASATVMEADAEKFYQQLLQKYREDFSGCIQEIDVKLGETPERKSGGAAGQTAKQLNILIALDASGSMNDVVVGGKKIDVAREAITRFLGALPKESKVGLVVFGHKGSNREKDKTVSCAGVETVYKVGALDQAQFRRAVESFQPTGYTPIAGALEHSGNILSASEGERNLVYLVTDGTETCGGDPVAAARALHGSNVKAVINVIGFNVGNAEQRQLKAVAMAGEGAFYTANNADELNKVFDDSSWRDRYWYTNTNNQKIVQYEFDNAIATFRYCVTNKTKIESYNIRNELNKLPVDDPEWKHKQYVTTRLRERHDRILEWKKSFTDNLENRRDVTLDQLKKELAAAIPEWAKK